MENQSSLPINTQCNKENLHDNNTDKLATTTQNIDNKPISQPNISHTTSSSSSSSTTSSITTPTTSTADGTSHTTTSSNSNHTGTQNSVSTTSKNNKLSERIIHELSVYPTEWQSRFIDYNGIQQAIKSYIYLYRQHPDKQQDNTKESTDPLLSAKYHEFIAYIHRQCTTLNQFYIQTLNSMTHHHQHTSSDQLHLYELLNSFCILNIEVLVKLIHVLDQYTTHHATAEIEEYLQTLPVSKRDLLYRTIYDIQRKQRYGEERRVQPQNNHHKQKHHPASSTQRGISDGDEYILANTSVEEVVHEKQVDMQTYPSTVPLSSPHHHRSEPSYQSTLAPQHHPHPLPSINALPYPTSNPSVAHLPTFPHINTSMNPQQQATRSYSALPYPTTSSNHTSTPSSYHPHHHPHEIHSAQSASTYEQQYYKKYKGMNMNSSSEEISYDDHQGESDEEAPQQRSQHPYETHEHLSLAHPTVGDSGGGGSKVTHRGFSCHQCKSTKSSHLLLFCSHRAAPDEKSKKGKKCRKKYCDSCLRRWYNTSVYEVTPQQALHWRCPSCYGECECATCRRRRNEQISNTYKQQQPSLNDSISSMGTSDEVSVDEHEAGSSITLPVAMTELKSPTSETGIGQLNIQSSDTETPVSPAGHRGTSSSTSSMKPPTSVPSTDRSISVNPSATRIHIPAPRHTVKRSREAQPHAANQPSTAPISVSSAHRTMSSQPSSSFLQAPSVMMESRAASDGRILNSANLHPSKTPRNSMIENSPGSSQKLHQEKHSHENRSTATTTLTPTSSSKAPASVSTPTPATPQWTMMKRDSLSIQNLMFNIHESQPTGDPSKVKPPSVPLMSIVVPGSKSLMQRQQSVNEATHTNGAGSTTILSNTTPRRLSLSQSNMLINSQTQFMVPCVYPSTETRKFSISSMLTPFTPIQLGGTTSSSTTSGAHTLLMSPIPTPMLHPLQTPLPLPLHIPTSPFLKSEKNDVQSHMKSYPSASPLIDKIDRRNSWSLAL